MSAVAGLERGFLLPSRADRAAKRGQLVVTEYRYRVEVGSVLAGVWRLGRGIVLGLGRGIWGFIVGLVAIARLLLMMTMMLIQRPLGL